MVFTAQHDQTDCGPACLSMIASFYKKKYPLQFLRDRSYINREGVSLFGITEAAQGIGFETLSGLLSLERLIEEKDSLPCILHWNQNHFVILKKITQNFFSKKYRFHLADPAHGFITLSESAFRKSWISDGHSGIVLYLQPTDKFYDYKEPEEIRLSASYLINYLKPYKKQLALMVLMLFFGRLSDISFAFSNPKLDR
ncbi:cysteine peptidase family C39 domain-containing protein [Flavobacterium ginsengisoli]|uniref:cysteine peptidase family C39 domain-containing protein n=1 Tax=Flavobacterium ginsengisoli TaxID=871694 RepID=UPI0030FCDAB2